VTGILHIFFLILTLLLSVTCSSPPSTESESLQSIFSDRPPDSVAGDGSLIFQQAQTFDKLLRGKLTKEEELHFKKECAQSPKKNPFCQGFVKRRNFIRVAQEKTKQHKPSTSKEVAPLVAHFKEGKLINITELRKGTIESLLKGFSSAPEAELTNIANILLKGNKCPNRAAVALAASLEDYLPQSKQQELVAELYSLGARCSRGQAVDREHYLTRAGLFFIWNQNYKRAIDTLKKVTPTDAFSGRALYWLAVAQKELGEGVAAESTLNRLINRHPLSFHSLLASHGSKTTYLTEWLSDRKIEKTRTSRALKANGFIEQAEILKKYGFDFSAAVITDWLFRTYHHLEGEVRLHLASLADPPTAVIQIPGVLLGNPQLASRNVLELMFPKPFYEVFVRNSRGLDPYLLLSIARKESRFNTQAVSSANAQGLMQINPATAKRMTGNESDNLFNPSTSIDLAARHLSEDLSRFDGHLPHAIAAYNAGEEAVSNWIRRYTVNNPILFIDLIPYRETRDYTGFVLSYYYWYRKIYSNHPEEALPIQS
jgi:soluble lytic murein transglycosylase